VQPPTISVKIDVASPQEPPGEAENITDRATRVFHAEQLVADGGESDTARHWRLLATSQFSSLRMIIAYRAAHARLVVHPYLTVNKMRELLHVADFTA
jgi:hypothetical protein